MIRISKNTTAFRFASVQDIKLQNIINGTSSRNSLWHLYEVLSQTSELSEGTSEELAELKSLFFSQVGIDDFFKTLYFCFNASREKMYSTYLSEKMKGRQLVEFLALFKIYANYISTGNLIFNYDEDIKALRLIEYKDWPQFNKDMMIGLTAIMDNDFAHIDWDTYWLSRK